MRARWSEVFLAVAMFALAAALVFVTWVPPETARADSSDFTSYWSSDLLTVTAGSQRFNIPGGKAGALTFINPTASTATVYIRLGEPTFTPNATAVDLEHIVLAPGESAEVGGHKIQSFAYIRGAGAATLRYYITRF